MSKTKKEPKTEPVLKTEAEELSLMEMCLLMEGFEARYPDEAADLKKRMLPAKPGCFDGISKIQERYLRRIVELIEDADIPTIRDKARAQIPPKVQKIYDGCKKKHPKEFKEFVDATAAVLGGKTVDYEPPECIMEMIEKGARHGFGTVTYGEAP